MDRSRETGRKVIRERGLNMEVGDPEARLNSPSKLYQPTFLVPIID